MPTTNSGMDAGGQPSTVKDLRLRLLANGYTPLPNVAKMTLLKGWPAVEVTAEEIASWSRRHSRWQDTGIRVQDGLAVIDFDIDDEEMMNEIARRAEEAQPGLSRSLVRYGKGFKEAWFVRTGEAFGRIHTRRWVKPGGDLDKDGSHVVEIFGGASPRQFGAFGAHTREPDGSVKISYQWAANDDDGPVGPDSVPLADLPEFVKADFFLIVDLAERCLEEHGWQPVMKTARGESEATRVHDLVEDMVFETNEGESGVAFAELRKRAGENGLRVSASFIEPGRGHSLTRCLVGRTHSGGIAIWDSATDVTHLAADRDPALSGTAERKLDMNRVAEKLQELKDRRKARLSGEDDYLQAAGKLEIEWAYCPTNVLSVVPMYATTLHEGMTLGAFRTMMLPWCGEEIGPRGGVKKINPADIWASSSRRVTIAGQRLRPDRPRPTYEEDGKTYGNIYSPEIHQAEGGDASVGQAFLRQLLPDAAEREWFTRWLAYKYRHPDVPGPAVVFVARAHGTGRGTAGELVRRLFGARYVKTLGFDHFAGRTYQSQYNDWAADSLVVLVNESSTADNGSSYRTKHDTYERLKEIVDPRPQERHFIVKGERSYDGISFTSYIIATNNPDALPLPADDRRFWVGTNGEPQPVEYWEGVNRWLEDDANIAAFARWLEELDLEDYSPFATPPMTDGKAAMMELSGSSIDHAYEEAITYLDAGDLVIPEQVLAAMRAAAQMHNWELPDRWEAMARRMVQSKLYRIGVRHGQNWFLKFDGKKYGVYARGRREASRWTDADAEDVRREVLRNGKPGAPIDIAKALSKLQVVGGNEA